MAMLQSFLNSKKVTAFPCGASAGTRERLGSSELFSLSLPHAEIRPLDRPDFFRAQKDMDVEAVLSRAAVLLAKKRAELAGRDDITPSELRHAARDIPVNPPWSTAAVILAGFEAEKAGKKYVSSSDISKAAEKITCPLKEAAPTVLLAVVRAELSGAETADLDAAYADVPKDDPNVPKDDPNAAAAVLLAVERAKASKNSEISKRDIDAALRDMPGNPRWNEAAVMIAAHDVYARKGTEIGLSDLKRGLHKIVGEASIAPAVSLLALMRSERRADAREKNLRRNNTLSPIVVSVQRLSQTR
ncbi:unknown [Acetobacter sp. CAG:977]|nr:unknown [Acetobacter sp. CAG:977]